MSNIGNTAQPVRTRQRISTPRMDWGYGIAGYFEQRHGLVVAGYFENREDADVEIRCDRKTPEGWHVCEVSAPVTFDVMCEAVRFIMLFSFRVEYKFATVDLDAAEQWLAWVEWRAAHRCDFGDLTRYMPSLDGFTPCP